MSRKVTYLKKKSEIWIQFSGGSRIPVGAPTWWGGRQLPRRLRFEKFVCQNERIWTLRGECRQRPPGSANAIDLGGTSLLKNKPSRDSGFVDHVRNVHIHLVSTEVKNTKCFTNWVILQWWIQGALPARAPLRVQILSFWHTNFLKRSRLGSWHPPPTRSVPPPWESWICYCFNKFRGYHLT